MNVCALLLAVAVTTTSTVPLTPSERFLYDLAVKAQANTETCEEDLADARRDHSAAYDAFVLEQNARIDADTRAREADVRAAQTPWWVPFVIAGAVVAGVAVGYTATEIWPF